jgi:serine/threonine protein kinase
MEKGYESLADFQQRKQHNFSRLEQLAIAESILDVVISAHKANIVLMNLKPANLVRCMNAGHEYVLKAVDFDCSRRVGEEIDGSIAQFG